MTKLNEGDVVWFLDKSELKLYECVIQDYIDGYYYTFATDRENDKTLMMPLHIDNIRLDEEKAKRELFVLRLKTD